MPIAKKLPVEYQIGIENLDIQHYTIIATLEEIVKFQKKGTDCHEAIGITIAHLFSYAKNHLDYEERLMKKVAYPELSDHLEQHELFRQKIDEIITLSEHYTNKKVILNSAAVFIKDWFLNHICSVDLEFATYYNEKKAEAKPI